MTAHFQNQQAKMQEPKAASNSSAQDKTSAKVPASPETRLKNPVKNIDLSEPKLLPKKPMQTEALDQYMASLDGNALDLVLEDAGIHSDRTRQFLQITPKRNIVYEKAFRLNLYRRAAVGRAHSEAEAMLYFAAPISLAYGIAGGPLGVLHGALHNLNLATAHNRNAYKQERNLMVNDLNIIRNIGDHFVIESGFSVEAIRLSRNEAILSGNRGGEFFCKERFTPKLYFNLEDEIETGDMFTNRFEGSRVGSLIRWAGQPVEVAGSIVNAVNKALRGTA